MKIRGLNFQDEELVKWTILREHIFCYPDRIGWILKELGQCKHKDAIELYNIICECRNASDIFAQLEKNAQKTVEFEYYHFLMKDELNLPHLKQIVKKGSVWAIHVYAAYLKEEKRLYWLRKGASLGDAMCMRFLSERNEEGWELLLKRAAELGDTTAIRKYARTFFNRETDVEFWKLHHMANPYALLPWTDNLDLSNPVVFYIGSLPSVVQLNDNCKTYYQYVCLVVSRECAWWSIVGRRLGVCRDVRVFIGKILWGTRVEGR